MTEPPTMKEKRELIKNTYLAHTHSDEGGRYARPNNVIGSSPVSYPRLPQSSPWSQPDPSGPEPAYGQDISEAPIVGEYAEVQASLDQHFGVQRSLRDGAPPSVGFSSVPTASELAPGGEVVRCGQAEEPALREPLTPSGRHSITQRRVSPHPIKRRLV